MKAEIKQTHQTASSHTKQKSPRPSANPQHPVKPLTSKDVFNIAHLGSTTCTCCPKPQPCCQRQEMARTTGMLGRAQCNAGPCQGCSTCHKGFPATFKRTWHIRPLGKCGDLVSHGNTKRQVQALDAQPQHLLLLSGFVKK